MKNFSTPWDYLIVTASNPEQSRAYRTQLGLRRKLGFLDQVGDFLVVPDPEGRRIGSGASTILCLIEVLKREFGSIPEDHPGPEAWRKRLRGKRILIVHAGGDSRRLPAYGPCGKLFIPAPGESDRALGMTLFDRQLPIYLQLPPYADGRGQVVVTAGDVFLDFDPHAVSYRETGLTGLGSWTDPETASRHGVFCPGPGGRVRRFLQKPSPSDQETGGVLDRYRRALLDIGVMSLDMDAAVRFLELFGAQNDGNAGWTWSGPLAEAAMTRPVDFFREFTCAMGGEVGFEHYRSAVRASGSALDDILLKKIFDAVSRIPFFVRTLSQCFFYHFGTPRQLVRSGGELLRRDKGPSISTKQIEINNIYNDHGVLSGRESWVEGCVIHAPVELGGGNVLVGADIHQPLSLPPGACLDVIQGKNQHGKSIRFIRVYGIDDTFKQPFNSGAVFCGRNFTDWLRDIGGEPSDLWEDSEKEEERTLWNARLFPQVSEPNGFMDWLWIWDPGSASEDQRKSWREAHRSSLCEIARASDHSRFHERRLRHSAQAVLENMPSVFRPESGFSASELALVMSHLSPRDISRAAAVMMETAWRSRMENPEEGSGMEKLGFSRIIHTLADAILEQAELVGPDSWRNQLRAAGERVPEPLREEIGKSGLVPGRETDVAVWAENMRHLAFRNLGETIVPIQEFRDEYPKIGLRDDEIIWGRAAARLDLGGGWTDTPPYSLERGGRVLNAAVDLNGQPPIQVYARRSDRLEIRISSIDHGAALTIKTIEQLMDYREPTSRFGLAKAALALMGFSPDRSLWPTGARTLSDMLKQFGGGIELTTLAAIPSGSGLGTSSIMGSVLIAVIGRMIGREPDARELFHKVLQLEQELTTGGGWQDQIGGSVPGVKLISTEAGLIPDPRIQYYPGDVLDPEINGGLTLLYYTGIRRLAKNILQNVVGRYLDRDRAAMATLSELYQLPDRIGEALSMKSLSGFGAGIHDAWRLNKRIDPESSTPVIEEILARLKPHIHGAKLLGAGGGGFLLIICRTRSDALAVRLELEKHPPNRLARFFDYSISPAGLEVTVC